MIRRLQVLNYRGLRYLDLRLAPFQILVGRNGSGKSAVLDAIAFLRDLVSSGLEAAVEQRTRDFRDLVWGRPAEDPGFELAVECGVAEYDPEALPEPPFEPRDDRVFRYEVAIREEEGAPRLVRERGLLGSLGAAGFVQPRSRFPDPPPAPPTLFVDADAGGYRQVLTKTGAEAMRFSPESAEMVSEEWEMPYSYDPGQSALARLPDALDGFPAAFRARQLLSEVRPLRLDSAALRRPCPYPWDASSLSPDGANLPWVAQDFRSKHADGFSEWLDHVRMSFPEIADLRVVVREEDRHAYLVVRDASDVELPSWSLPAGMLRLLALTLPAFLQGIDCTYLVEEPEDGLHPEIMQEAYDALSQIHGSQTLVATQSPVFLTDADPKKILCFAKDARGVSDVAPVLAHPRLKEWIGSPHLSDYFSTGLLG